MTDQSRTDIYVETHGSLILLIADSPEGKDWLNDHVDEDAPRLGSNVACEPRYAKAIIQGMREDGLTLRCR